MATIDKLLTIKEVAEQLRRKTNRTVLELIKSRELKCIYINERVMLVRQSELDRFLAEKEKQ